MQTEFHPSVPVCAEHFEFEQNRSERDHQMVCTQVALLTGKITHKRVLLGIRAKVVRILVSGQRAKVNVGVELVWRKKDCYSI